MDKEQVYLQSAFVLHQRPYQNTSVIIDVFTRDYGRFSLIAKGVKQHKSALKSVLQSFQPLSISWVRRSELGVLTSAEFQNPVIKLNQENLYAGLYLNELIIRLVHPFDAMPELYNAYADTLASFNENMSVAVILRLFEKQLLQSLGYEIQLRHEAEFHQPIAANKYYAYIPEFGFVERAAGNESKLNFKGEHLLAFAENQITHEDVLKIAHQLIHVNLKKLLGEKPLKSRELYKAYKAINL